MTQRAHGELCELLPGHQPACGFSEAEGGAAIHLEIEAIEVTRFGLGV